MGTKGVKQPSYVNLSPEARQGVEHILARVDRAIREDRAPAHLVAARAWIAHQVVRTDRRAENRRAIKAGYDTPGTVNIKMRQAKAVVNAFDSFFRKQS